MPCYHNLANVYNNYTGADISTTMDKFVIPSNRQGRSACPAGFKAISDFKWEADEHAFMQCPSASYEGFTCSGTPIVAAPVVTPQPTSGGFWGLPTILVAASIVVLVVGLFIYSRKEPEYTDVPEMSKVDEETVLVAKASVSSAESLAEMGK